MPDQWVNPDGSFKKDGTVLGNMFRILLALLTPVPLWFGLYWHYTDATSALMGKLGLSYNDEWPAALRALNGLKEGASTSLAFVVLPAVILGCVLGSATIVTIFQFALNAFDDTKLHHYIGYFKALAIILVISGLPLGIAYLNALAQKDRPKAMLSWESPQKATSPADEKPKDANLEKGEERIGTCPQEAQDYEVRIPEADKP